jgi:hypothetical protein
MVSLGNFFASIRSIFLTARRFRFYLLLFSTAALHHRHQWSIRNSTRELLFGGTTATIFLERKKINQQPAKRGRRAVGAG